LKTIINAWRLWTAIRAGLRAIGELEVGEEVTIPVIATFGIRGARYDTSALRLRRTR